MTLANHLLLIFHLLLLGGFLNFFPTSLSARFIIIALAVRALMELLTEHNPIFCPNPELKTLIIYYYKETITTGSVHIMHNNDDNEENFCWAMLAERASTNAA